MAGPPAGIVGIDDASRAPALLPMADLQMPDLISRQLKTKVGE